MNKFIEKLLPRRFWSERVLAPEQLWAAFASMPDEHPVYRALMYEVQDWFMQNALVTFDREQPDAKRLAAANVAGELAKLMQRVEEYRAGAKAQLEKLEKPR